MSILGFYTWADPSWLVFAAVLAKLAIEFGQAE